MNIQFFVPTYQRPKILDSSLKTLVNNTSIKPDAMWIFDDCSEPDLQLAILRLAQEVSRGRFPVHTLFHGKNLGVGWNFENIYLHIKQHNPDVAVIAESDYVWRKGWLEDVVAVFEAAPHTIAIAGVSHPDMEDRQKTHGDFPKLMIDQFGFDIESRPNLYKPFKLKTSRGEITVRGVSNSCGCQIIHWRRLQEILDYGSGYIFANKHLGHDTYWRHLDRAFHKNGTGDRRYASDAHMSGTLSMFAELYMRNKNVDFMNNFGMLDIEDFSISQHVCGGETSINGKIVPEGSTFIISKSWRDEFLEKDPRLI